MYMTPFRVRLASNTSFKEGYIGSVVGVKQVKNPDGSIMDMQAVIWNLVDEDTGIEATGDQPTPSFHTATELRTHVDPPHWDELDFEEEEEEEDDTTESRPAHSDLEATTLDQ